MGHYGYRSPITRFVAKPLTCPLKRGHSTAGRPSPVGINVRQALSANGQPKRIRNFVPKHPAGASGRAAFRWLGCLSEGTLFALVAKVGTTICLAPGRKSRQNSRIANEVWNEAMRPGRNAASGVLYPSSRFEGWLWFGALSTAEDNAGHSASCSPGAAEAHVARGSAKPVRSGYPKSPSTSG